MGLTDSPLKKYPCVEYSQPRFRAAVMVLGTLVYSEWGYPSPVHVSFAESVWHGQRENGLVMPGLHGELHKAHLRLVYQQRTRLVVGKEMLDNIHCSGPADILDNVANIAVLVEANAGQAMAQIEESWAYRMECMSEVETVGIGDSRLRNKPEYRGQVMLVILVLVG